MNTSKIFGARAAGAALLALGLWPLGAADIPKAQRDPIEPAAEARDWVEPMRTVHSRFTGTAGTFAHLGDSITFTMAFWSPLAGQPQQMSPEMAHAQVRVKAYLSPDCWSGWKGPEFGNNGSMTIRWAREHIDDWIRRLNPEVALIMFGSNDVGQMDAQEYESRTRQVIVRCLTNGTVVILSTMPPRARFEEKSREFTEVIRRLAREFKVPMTDYYAEILKRRPDDWNGSLPQFKEVPGDEYQVPTLICRDGVHPSNPKRYAGVYSEEALRSNGYTLRNYLTLMIYDRVIENVLRPKQRE